MTPLKNPINLDTCILENQSGKNRLTAFHRVVLKMQHCSLMYRREPLLVQDRFLSHQFSSLRIHADRN
jgi:hypothetical protein